MGNSAMEYDDKQFLINCFVAEASAAVDAKGLMMVALQWIKDDLGCPLSGDQIAELYEDICMGEA